LLTTLFGFPEYDRSTVEFFSTALHELMRAKDPILQQIKTDTVEYVPNSQVSTDSGEAIVIQPILNQMEFPLTLMDAVEGKLESFITSIDIASETGLRSLMSQIFERIGQVCDATGNTMDAQGQPISHDFMRQILEKVEMRFDEEGNHGTVFCLPPTVIEQLKALPPPTAEQEQEWNELIERKRREFNARKRYRQLS
jgi:hypothetical protein